MQQSEKRLQDLIKNRVSKIDYALTSTIPVDKKRLFFHQGCQTKVDTQTFIRILDTYKAWITKKANLANENTQTDLSSDGVHLRYYKSPRRFGQMTPNEFAQQVTEKDIQYAYDLRRTELKNLSFLYAAEPSPHRPLQQHFSTINQPSQIYSNSNEREDNHELQPRMQSLSHQYQEGNDARSAGQEAVSDHQNAMRSQPNESTAQVAQTNFRGSNAVSNESGSSRNADPLSFGYLNAQSLVLNRFNQPSYDLPNKQVQFHDQSLQAKELREHQQDQARGVTDTSHLPSHLNSNDTTLNRSGDTSNILNANQATGGPVNLGPDAADNQDLSFLSTSQSRNQHGPSSHSALSHAL